MNYLIVYPHGNALNKSSGAESRIWNFVDSLINLKLNVYILHSIKSKGFEDPDLIRKCKVFYYKDLTLFGITDWYFTDFNIFFLIKLNHIIRKYNINIVQLEFPWGFFGIRLIKKRNTRIIYDSLGVESKFIEVVVNNPKFPKFPKFFKNIIKFYVRIYEKNVCKLADVIINVSRNDQDYYIDNFCIEKKKTVLIQIPSAFISLSSDYTEDDRKKFRNKLGLPKSKTIVIFHGGLLHPPNKEAFDLIINYLSKEIDIPDIIFALAGNHLNEFKNKNVISLGFVKNLPFLLYSADFAIVPIISGSGMRVKCSDYISAALPFITTKKGIEGITFLKNGVDCIICEDVNYEFVNAIKLLYHNRELRLKFHNNLLIKSKYISKASIEKRIKNLILTLKLIR